MKELAIRFVIGGLAVCAFSAISDVFKPKTFAGLFGAAPSIALASLALTILLDSKEVAAVEARSMIIGAAAFFVYASVLSYLLLRFKLPALSVGFSALLLWLGMALGLWRALLAS
ncbi:MAG: DUF3147 family protein [Acidobacteria bacterium]|nr:DUF3147 family protein [Acidobacteriota bacterium]MBV9623453.1 DUF3147 family protein [Acidobacteriota bacterium]